MHYFNIYVNALKQNDRLNTAVVCDIDAPKTMQMITGHNVLQNYNVIAILFIVKQSSRPVMSYVNIINVKSQSFSDLRQNMVYRFDFTTTNIIQIDLKRSKE